MPRPTSSVRVLLVLFAVIAGVFGAAGPAHGAVYGTVTAGVDHTCGIRPGGAVYCWGLGQAGQLGVIGATRARSPLAVIGSYTAADVTAGDQYWCELRVGGKVACTGQNSSGQLGTGGLSPAQFPQEVVGLPPASKVDAGRATTCAIAADGLYCWGDSTYGQNGGGELVFDPVPTAQKVPNIPTPTGVSVGSDHVCALRSDRQVQCWGSTEDGRLGNGRQSAITEAGPLVEGLTDATSVAAGQRHTCALRAAGTVVCWGSNAVGQLGAGPIGSTRTPTPVSGLAGVVQISTNTSTTCAVKNDGTVWCWGEGVSGQLGNNARVNSNVPVQVQGIAGATAASVGVNHACAVTNQQVPFCWGSNRYAQLGSGGIIGGAGIEPTAQVVQDAVRGTASFLPTPLAERNRTNRGGQVYLRLLRLTRRGSKCPTSAAVTIRTRGKSVVRTVRDIEKVEPPERACLVTGRLDLPAATQRAFTVVVVVRGSHLKTRKVKLRPKIVS